MEVLLMQFSPASCHFLPLTPPSAYVPALTLQHWPLGTIWSGIPHVSSGFVYHNAYVHFGVLQNLKLGSVMGKSCNLNLSVKEGLTSIKKQEVSVFMFLDWKWENKRFWMSSSKHTPDIAIPIKIFHLNDTN